MDSCLEQLRTAVASATNGMTTDDLTRRREGKWSAAEVLEHLYLSYTGTTKGCERCLQAGRPLARAPGWKDRLVTAVVVGAGYFPRGRKATKHTLPSGHFGGESACGHWVADCGHGCLNRSMRDPVWKEHPNHGSSRVRPINRSAVAQVSLGAWEAPCKADFAAARKKVILFFHLSEFRSLSGRILAYGIIEEGTPALRARSFMSCSSSLAVFTLFCFSASCCLYWASSLSHEPALRKRLPASA